MGVFILEHLCLDRRIGVNSSGRNDLGVSKLLYLQVLLLELGLVVNELCNCLESFGLRLEDRAKNRCPSRARIRREFSREVGFVSRGGVRRQNAYDTVGVDGGSWICHLIIC